MSDAEALFDAVPHRDAYSRGWSIDVAAIARDEAVDVVEQASDDWSRRVVDQAIRAVGRQRGFVSANDIRDLLPQVRPALVGARFLAASRRGDLEEAGSLHATHAAGHARRIVRWRWTEAG